MKRQSVCRNFNVKQSFKIDKRGLFFKMTAAGCKNIRCDTGNIAPKEQFRRNNLSRIILNTTLWDCTALKVLAVGSSPGSPWLEGVVFLPQINCRSSSGWKKVRFNGVGSGV